MKKTSSAVSAITWCVMIAAPCVFAFTESGMPTSIHSEPVPGQRQALPAEFVNLADFIPGIVVDVKYAGRDNFMGRQLEGYHAGKVFMLRVPAMALRKVHDSLTKRGYRLKVFDAYRPMRAERDMIQWAGGKRERLAYIREGYVPSRVWPERRVGHVCGNTVDLTLVDVSGKEVDMGTAFDAFTRESWTMNARGRVLENRLQLKREMEAQGFVNYEREWWHFTFPSYPAPAQDVEIK